MSGVDLECGILPDSLKLLKLDSYRGRIAPGDLCSGMRLMGVPRAHETRLREIQLPAGVRVCWMDQRDE